MVIPFLLIALMMLIQFVIAWKLSSETIKIKIMFFFSLEWAKMLMWMTREVKRIVSSDMVRKFPFLTLFDCICISTTIFQISILFLCLIYFFSKHLLLGKSRFILICLTFLSNWIFYYYSRKFWKLRVAVAKLSAFVYL